MAQKSAHLAFSLMILAFIMSTLFSETIALPERVKEKIVMLAPSFLELSYEKRRTIQEILHDHPELITEAQVPVVINDLGFWAYISFSLEAKADGMHWRTRTMDIGLKNQILKVALLTLTQLQNEFDTIENILGFQRRNYKENNYDQYDEDFEYLTHTLATPIANPLGTENHIPFYEVPLRRFYKVLGAAVKFHASVYKLGKLLHLDYSEGRLLYVTLQGRTNPPTSLRAVPLYLEWLQLRYFQRIEDIIQTIYRERQGEGPRSVYPGSLLRSRLTEGKEREYKPGQQGFQQNDQPIPYVSHVPIRPSEKMTLRQFIHFEYNSATYPRHLTYSRVLSFLSKDTWPGTVPQVARFRELVEDAFTNVLSAAADWRSTLDREFDDLDIEMVRSYADRFKIYKEIYLNNKLQIPRQMPRPHY